MQPIVLYNAHFVSFHRHNRSIRSILLNNGLIEEIYYGKTQTPKNTLKFDLKGSYVLPGFIDSHTHIITRGIELQRIDLEKCTSQNDCLEKVRSELRSNSEILFGSNWDESTWRSCKTDQLNRYMLDKISNRIPVIIRRICGHMAIVNTKALHSIPKYWTIVDRKTGYLYEDIALNLNEIFKPSDTIHLKAIELGSAEALKKGITSVHEIADPHRFRLLQRIKRKRRLNLRFAIYILSKYLPSILKSGMSSGLGDDFLKLAGIKVFCDGSVGAKTAAMKKPYKGLRTRGKILVSKQKLNSIIKEAEKNGLQLMVHSIGDRTTAEILKVFEKNIKPLSSGVKNPLRHRLEHIEILDDASIKKMARMNLIASMQPNFARRWQHPGGLYECYLSKRYKEMNCFRKLYDAGVKVIFGSDCMPLGPLYGIKGAHQHPFSCGRLSRKEAFKMYTKAGAYATFEECKKGTVEKGKFADLVVLDKNPLKEKNLDDIKILMTIVNGKMMYRRKSCTIR